MLPKFFLFLLVDDTNIYSEFDNINKLTYIIYRELLKVKSWVEINSAYH